MKRKIKRNPSANKRNRDSVREVEKKAASEIE